LWYLNRYKNKHEECSSILNVLIKKIRVYLSLIFVPLEYSETTKIIIDSLYCSSPRKSLVKGERFMRGEEKPELTLVWMDIAFVWGKKG